MTDKKSVRADIERSIRGKSANGIWQTFMDDATDPDVIEGSHKGLVGGAAVGALAGLLAPRAARKFIRGASKYGGSKAALAIIGAQTGGLTGAIVGHASAVRRKKK